MAIIYDALLKHGPPITPVLDRLRYVVIGGGMSGILAAIKLKEAGSSNFIVYEKGDSVGGTWRENRYPGLTCDVPSHAYTYSFRTNPEWSAYFAPGPEIHDYFKDAARHYGVEDRIRLNSEVVACTFNDATHRWRIALKDGSTDEADVVIAATGVLHHPYSPDLPGMESFAGRMFHSARWDDSAETGGKRIGVIGTGSTGVQIVGALASSATRIVHFVRTPQWIMPGYNYAYDEAQKARFRTDPASIDDIRYGETYQSYFQKYYTAVADVNSPELAAVQAAVEAHLEESIRDPALKARLRPDYRAMCKRLVVSPHYYDVIQQPHVAFETGAIARVEPDGIRMADGTVHELDVIVLATGFAADRFIRPTRVTGRGGVSLDDAWARRPAAYNAIAVPDFPNLFFLNGPSAPVGNFSLIKIAEFQWNYIVQLLQELEDGLATEISASAEALADYERRRIETAGKTVFSTGCTSWYLDKEGVPSGWPWSYGEFVEAMKMPRRADFDRLYPAPRSSRAT